MSTVSISEATRQLSQLVNRAAYGREVLILTSRGQAKAVLIGIDAFQELVGASQYAQRDLMPLDTFQHRFRDALAEAGYDTQEKVVELAREVRRAAADERNPSEEG
ncbi:MAG: type II toxin-antitoxin system Phd/YefM family antitoxin [Anaerolineales bacterium]|jgi:prevent-host-death family protein